MNSSWNFIAFVSMTVQTRDSIYLWQFHYCKSIWKWRYKTWKCTVENLINFGSEWTISWDHINFTAYNTFKKVFRYNFDKIADHDTPVSALFYWNLGFGPQIFSFVSIYVTKIEHNLCLVWRWGGFSSTQTAILSKRNQILWDRN